MTSTNSLPTATRLLHWVVALLMIGLLCVGFVMATFELYALYPLHKAFGVLALLIIVPRAVLRLVQGWPVPVRHYPAWEHGLAVLMHWVLLLGTLLMPLSGLAMSAAGGHGVDVFGFQLFAANPDPAQPGEVLPLDATLAGIGHTVHWLAGYAVAAAVLLHVAGALKHHVLDKDRTLLRMLGR